MNIKPLKDNVLIEPEKEEDKSQTDAGIYLPESVETPNERPQIGEVLEIGDSKNIKVEKGQRVIFNKYSGTEVNLEKKSLLLVRNNEVLAVIK
jgi:chaperonin GroES